MNDADKVAQEIEMAHAQALKYGQDLVRIYNQEKAKRQELELTNQKLNAIWTTAPNGLAVLDERLHIIQTNPRFEILLEQQEQCIGHYLGEVIPSKELSAALITAAREETPFANIEVSITDPMERTLQITGAPLYAGDQRGWVVSLHDLTERKRLEGLKEEFIDIAAHELRTPLAIILGFASVLREDIETHDEMTAAPIDAIVQAANRLKMIINELVEFATTRSDSGAALETEHFDLWEVIEHAIGSVSHQANRANVAIVTEATYEQSTMVSGDRVIIAQALGHILENAIKFNKPQGTVYVRAMQSEENTIMEIEDTGIGIPATQLGNIFEMFYQVEEHMTRARGGLGMGLSIARRGIELHGGSITVTSSLDQGSCFRITLPLKLEPVSISTQERLDAAHKLTLAYGRDIARASVAQQHLNQRLQRVQRLSQELLSSLENSLDGTIPMRVRQDMQAAYALAVQIVEVVKENGANHETRDL